MHQYVLLLYVLKRWIIWKGYSINIIL